MEPDKSDIIIVFLLAVILVLVFSPLKLYNVHGNSMEPNLSSGDLVISYPSEDYSETDVIVYDNGQKFVIHRIINVTENDRYITKGDNNNLTDQVMFRMPPVEDEQIEGGILEKKGVIIKIPLIGLLIDFMKKYLLVVVSIIVLLLLVHPIKED